MLNRVMPRSHLKSVRSGQQEKSPAVRNFATSKVCDCIFVLAGSVASTDLHVSPVVRMNMTLHLASATNARSAPKMSANNNLALFIDGANLYATAKTLGFEIDFKRLLKEFQNGSNLLRAFYYTAIIEDQEYSSVRPLIDWLGYNGYTVVTKAVKEFADTNGRRKLKGSMDIELAVDAMEIAEHIDEMILFSGDGDFRSLVEAVQRRGVRVTVISTIASHPSIVADELRRQADVFVDLMELRAKLAREPSERQASREPRIAPL
jgi:uncharacterized LabA/DUF88 family protein